MALRLTLALTGNLKREMERELAAAEKAVTAGVRTATAGLKGELRAQVRRAGLGNRLANAWRGQDFPRAGTSLGAKGFVFTRAPRLIEAFAKNTTIRANRGVFLAIPTDAAPKRGVGGRKISPETFPEHRFGPLRFVSRGRGRPALLVVDNVRVGRTGRVGALTSQRKNTGRFTRTTGRSTVAMFVLVPQVRLRKRLDADRAARFWTGRLGELIVRNLPRG